MKSADTGVLRAMTGQWSLPATTRIKVRLNSVCQAENSLVIQADQRQPCLHKLRADIGPKLAEL